MEKLTKKQRLLQIEMKRLLLFACIVASACVATWYGLSRVAPTTLPQRMVTIYDRGIERSIITTAITVRSALHSAGIEVDPRDTVEPTVDTKLTGSRFNVVVYRSRLVTIIDGATRQTVMTPRQSANEMLQEAQLKSLKPEDKIAFTHGNLLTDGAQTKLTVTRHIVEEVAPPTPKPLVFTPKPNALTPSKGAHIYVDSDGVAHRETYYDLPMSIVMQTCGVAGSYTIRSDGAKIDQDGYILVAANLAAYPRCTVVDTSMGPGKVYDTGGFAVRHPYGFDLATDWSRADGI